ncbi:MAG: hypothetical protein LBQ18_03435, partial [Campylobacteraceae bacterium]|nr:hypothetical protein [Campylobacteraceae bacterium]
MMRLKSVFSFFSKKFFIFAVLISAMNSNVYAWQCDKLYSVEDSGDVWALGGFTDGSKSYSERKEGANFDGRDTIALGPYNAPTGSLTMIAWDYPLTDTAFTMGTYSHSGQRNPSYQTNGPAKSGTGSGWPGGEINKLTGELYLSSGPGGKNQPVGSFKILVYKYGSPSYRMADVRALGQSVYDVASDMAIDAEGNVIMLARKTDSDSSWVIMKVNVGKSGGTWSYSIMGDVLRWENGGHADMTNTLNSMAFFKGKLYAAGRNTNEFYEINPMSGTVRELYSLSRVSYDFASCDVAASITGKIYNDTDGDGEISGNEPGIPNIEVEIYDRNNKYRGVTTTDNTGMYSFLVDKVGAGEYFYIRVKQPIINGIRAAQTWASGGQFPYIGPAGSGTNTVTNFCTDFSKDDTSGSASNRTCYGKRVDGRESSSSNLADANYYSKVEMVTDKKVPHADFAFSTVSDRSDSDQIEVLHNLAIKGVGGAYRAYLGDSVTIDSSSIKSAAADKDAGDDGIFVLVNGRYVPVQQRAFVKNMPYQFRADINGVLKNSAKLNVWFSQATQLSQNTAALASSLNNATGSSIFFTGTTPNDSGAASRVLRARFSTSAGVNAANSVSSNSNDPWVMDGEVEDYQVFLLSKQLRISLKTVGTSGNSGDFTFKMGNVLSSSPSSDSVTFSTPAPNVITDEPKMHEINKYNTAIPITVDRPQTLGVVKSQTNCTDISNNNADIPITFSRYQDGGKWHDNITIPSTSVKSNSDIVCLFTYGAAPVITIEANVTNRAFVNDNFNLSIKDIDTNSIMATNSTAGTNTIFAKAILEADHTNNISISMIQGSTGKLGRYKIEAACSGTNPVTVTDGWFTLKTALADNIVCKITLTAPAISTANSQIAVTPKENVAGNTSLVLVTLKDANNIPLSSGGDSIKVFINSPVTMQLSNGTHSIYSPTISGITAIDNGNGTYRAEITSNLTGEAVLTFSVNGNTANANATAKFRHLGVDMDSPNTAITIPNPNVKVSTNATALVRLADRFGNGVTNASVSLVVIANSTTPVIYNTNVRNHHNGTYEINLTAIKQGDVTVSFSADNINAKQSKNATATFLATDYNVSSPYSNITITPNSSIVGNAALITVYLSDTAGLNGIAGQDVRLVFAKSANATIYPDNATYKMNNNATLGNGYYTAWINSTIADIYTLSFKVGGNQSIHNASIRYNPADVDLSNTAHSYITSNASAQIGENATVKVYLADRYNNTIKNATVDIRVIKNNTGNFTPINSNNSISFTADASDPKGGYYKALYSTSVADTTTFGFNANSIAAPNSNNASTSFTSTGANIQSSHTKFAVTPKDNTVGDSVALNLLLSDNSSNPQAGYKVSFYVEQQNLINSVYISSVTDHKNGTYTAGASTNRSANATFYFVVDGVGNSSGVKTDWANFKQGAVDLNSNNSYMTVETPRTVNQPSKITVRLADSYNNTITDKNVTIFIVSNGTSGTPSIAPVTIYNGDYVSNLNSSKAGNITLNFNVEGIGNNTAKSKTVEYKADSYNITGAYTYIKA